MGSSRNFIDANDDRINVGTGIFDSYYQGSIVAWIRPDLTNGFGAIFVPHYINLTGLLFRWGRWPGTAERRIGIQAYQYPAFNEYVHGHQNLTNNVWQHVAVTSNGSTYKIYLNGVEQTLTEKTPGVSNNGRWFADCYDGSNAQIYYIGYDGIGFNNMTGQMTDVRVYSRALSATEVLRLVGGDIGGSPSSGLIGHWPMDEDGANPTFRDLSGNGNTGTNTGTDESFLAPNLYRPSSQRISTYSPTIIPPTPVPADAFSADLYLTKNRSRDMNLTKTRNRDLYSTRDREVTLVR